MTKGVCICLSAHVHELGVLCIYKASLCTLRTEAPAYDQISCRRASIGEGQFQSKYMETDETGRSTLTLFYSSYIRPTECYLNTYNTKVNIYLVLSCVAYISGLDVYVSAVGAVFLRLMYRPAVSVCMTH